MSIYCKKKIKKWFGEPLLTTKLITSSLLPSIGSIFSSLLFVGSAFYSAAAIPGEPWIISVFDFIRVRALVEFNAFGL